MAFEERYELLCKKSFADYNKTLQNANFDGLDVDDMEELAEKIAISKWIYNYVTTMFTESPTDVEALLFYDKPITSIFEYLCENRTVLLNGLIEPLNNFVQQTKHHIREVMKMWDDLPLDELQKAEIFTVMEKEIAKHEEESVQDDMER